MGDKEGEEASHSTKSGPPAAGVEFALDDEVFGEEERTAAKTVIDKIGIPKREERPSPFRPPKEKDLFDFTGQSNKQLHEDLKTSGRAAHQASQVRRGQLGEPPEERRDIQLGPPRRRRVVGGVTQPQTTRNYLLAARTTARDQNLARVAEVESHRLQKELQNEKAVNNNLESQLQYHEKALQTFLQYHYRQVTDALSKGEEARKHLNEQKVRRDYYSGLLAEAQTVQEEEEERLQELTAFQQFLAAVSPAQSLSDLKRRMKEIQDEVMMSRGPSGGSLPINPSDAVELSRAAAIAASVNSGALSPTGESGGGGGALGADLIALRMIQQVPSQSRPSSRTGSRPSSSIETPKELVPLSQDDSEICDAEAYDEFLDDDERLVNLAYMYESQCHGLLTLLTRLRDQTEAINKEIENRQRKLDTRLREIQQLQDKAKGGDHEDQLHDLTTLIGEWPGLSGDAEAQKQLDQLVAQIAEVVSDVFGSSEYSPLVPEARPEQSPKKQPPKVIARSSTNDKLGSPKRPEPPGGGATVSAGMGQEALLALLEARVTDLCAQLDTIDPALRDTIFLNCEQERHARLKEEKRQETEMRRTERKQRHLERAMAEPPPKPL